MFPDSDTSNSPLLSRLSKQKSLEVQLKRKKKIETTITLREMKAETGAPWKLRVTVP